MLPEYVIMYTCSSRPATFALTIKMSTFNIPPLLGTIEPTVPHAAPTELATPETSICGFTSCTTSTFGTTKKSHHGPLRWYRNSSNFKSWNSHSSFRFRFTFPDLQYCQKNFSTPYWCVLELHQLPDLDRHSWSSFKRLRRTARINSSYSSTFMICSTTNTMECSTGATPRS
jgi:hypothetical protein